MDRLISTAKLPLAFAVLTLPAFADHAMVGTWKQNRSKAQRPEETKTLTIERAARGITVRNGFGTLFTADFDEKETPMAMMPDDRVKLKRLGDRAFEMVFLMDGKKIQTTRHEVSPEGETMTTVTTLDASSEGRSTTTSLWKRVTGTGTALPFAGTWRLDTSKTDYAGEDVFTASQNGNILTIDEPNTGVRTTMDLKTGVTSMTGTNAPSDYKLSSRVIDDHTLEVTWSRGDMHGVSLYSVSGDGRTLTQKDNMNSTDKKNVVNVFVYERQ